MAGFVGIRILVRWVLAALLAMRADTPTCVRLLTERQAKRSGWPDARTANLARLFAWAILVEHCPTDMAFPPLVDADEAAIDPEPSFTAAPLASLEVLMAELYPYEMTSQVLREIDKGQALWASGAASTADTLPAAPADSLVRDWLGLDVRLFAALHPGAFDPADPRAPTQTARFTLAWILTEALDTYRAMCGEAVEAMRLKSDSNAEVACHPGAVASNLALLLAAALFHSSFGYIVIVLPPRPGFAESLVEAGHALGRRHQDKIAGSYEADIMALKDLCARDYVHVGRICQATR